METVKTRPKFNTMGDVKLHPILKHKGDYITAKYGKTANIKIHLKNLVIVLSTILNYCLIVFGGFGLFVNIFLFALLGLNFAMIGFNIMHDAGHGNYAERNWINEMLVLSLNFVGGNAFLWKFKHNILHHTYTNIDGHDEDIHIPLMRVHKSQPLKKYHKYQHIYCFFLYASVYFLWIWINDFVKYFTGKVHGYKTPKKTLLDHIIFWLSKAFYFFYMIYVPVTHIGLKEFIIGYSVLCIVCGLFISVIFQLAHNVEGVDNPVVNEKKIVEEEWVRHEIRTTANFATSNWFVTWFCGGLNFQIEHHLFPGINHVHYPKLQPYVKDVCVEYEILYNENPTLLSAIKSHRNYLERLGTEA